MAKAKKKKQFVPLFEDYFDQFNLLSFDQAGRLFALIRSYRTMDPEQFHALEASIALETGAKIIWSFLQSDLNSWYEEKQKKSETNAANARSRWKSAAPSPCSGDIPGQKSIIFTAEQAAPGAEPVLTAHAAGMRNDANGMRNDAVAPKNNAVASPIYNINNNSNIHNNNIYESDHSDSGIKSDTATPDISNVSAEIPTLETVIQFFLNNGSTEAAAKKYYDYYTLHDWKTAKGEHITDVKESVKRWIARDAQFWSTRGNITRNTSGYTGYKRAANKQYTPVSNLDQNQRHAGHWEGTYSSPNTYGKKPGSQFHDFDQREYDYDALLALINGKAM